MNGRPLDTLFSVLETEYGPLDASETTLVADAKIEFDQLRRELDEAVTLLRRIYSNNAKPILPSGEAYASYYRVMTDAVTFLSRKGGE